MQIYAFDFCDNFFRPWVPKVFVKSGQITSFWVMYVVVINLTVKQGRNGKMVQNALSLPPFPPPPPPLWLNIDSCIQTVHLFRKSNKFI